MEKDNKKILYLAVASVIIIASIALVKQFSTKNTDKVSPTDQKNQMNDSSRQNRPEMGPIGSGTPPEGGGRGFEGRDIDYAAVAEKLGLAKEDVENALTFEPGEGLNLESAAEALGVTIEDLRSALGVPEMGPPEDITEQSE